MACELAKGLAVARLFIVESAWSVALSMMSRTRVVQLSQKWSYA